MNTFIEALTALLVTPFRPNTERVLNQVNAARHALGLRPLAVLPGGAKGRPNACPLAVALGGFVGVDGICFDEAGAAERVAASWDTGIRKHGAGRYVVALPRLLQHFVRDFDLGAYRRLGAVA